MQVSRTRRGEVDILTLEGSVRGEDNTTFADALNELKEERRFRLVIDATDLEYVNSRAISEVIRFHQNAHVHGGKVAIVRPGQTVRKIMNAVGLGLLVQTFETLDEAVAACEP